MRRVLQFAFAAVLALPLSAAEAATIVAAEGMGTYSGQVLQRVAPHWHPPAGTAGNMVQVRVRIGNDGSVLGCEPAADTTQLDLVQAACAAVAHAGRMPTPEYGMSGVVHIAFMSDAAAAPRPEPLTTDNYPAAVMAAVRKNWTPPAVDGAYTVRVRLHVDHAGKVLDSAIDTSSGRKDIDAAALRAVAATGPLPPPPGGSGQELVLSFTVKGGN